MFVKVSHFHPTLIFVGKGLAALGWALALPVNVRLGKKGLAYYDTEMITPVKGFRVHHGTCLTCKHYASRWQN